jgi:hypothetical protein
MTLKLILAVTLIAVAPTAAFAQKDDPVDQAPKPTVEEAQKLVQTISSDKTKLQVYCEIGNLQKQMEKAQEENNTKALDALFAKLDSLEQQVGPEYARMMDGLGEVDLSSAEGQKFTAIFDPLHKQCK